jgi:hypothetical protein
VVAWHVWHINDLIYSELLMSTPDWGYDRADCIGDNALGLFLDDLDIVLMHYAGQVEQTESVLFQAQMAANKLVQAYDTHARATTAFARQSIEVKRIVHADNRIEFVPIFSAGLKSQLIKLLKRSTSTVQH